MVSAIDRNVAKLMSVPEPVPKIPLIPFGERVMTHA